MARIARAQHGIATWAQLRDAALLVCGPDAAISHWSSLAVFALWTRPRVVHVTKGVGVARTRRGIMGHRAQLAPEDVVVRHGLRVTTPARALVDIAPYTSVAELERLIEEIQVQDLATSAEIAGAIERGARRPGVRKLRTVADLLDEPAFTRSEAERRLLELVRSAKLPRPETNVRRAGWEVDAVWEARTPT
jgi:phage tail protein X